MEPTQQELEHYKEWIAQPHVIKLTLETRFAKPEQGLACYLLGTQFQNDGIALLRQANRLDLLPPVSPGMLSVVNSPLESLSGGLSQAEGAAEIARDARKLRKEKRSLPRAAILALYFIADWTKPGAVKEMIEEARELLEDMLKPELPPAITEEQRETLLRDEARYLQPDNLTRISGALSGLVEEGLVESKDISTGKVARREYRLLPAGIYTAKSHLLAHPRPASPGGANLEEATA